MLPNQSPISTSLNDDSLPPAYLVVTLPNRLFYPMRAGAFLRNRDGTRVSYASRAAAILCCHYDQRDRERLADR